MVNGYVTLDLASKNIYKEALEAIKAQKPVMVVDLPNVYFADTIKTVTDGDDVVVQITKGGKTITINDVNAVSSEGEIQSHLYQYNLDVFGANNNVCRFRFVANELLNITIDNIENIFVNYIGMNNSDNQCSCTGIGDGNYIFNIESAYISGNKVNYYGTYINEGSIEVGDDQFTITNVQTFYKQLF